MPLVVGGGEVFVADGFGVGFAELLGDGEGSTVGGIVLTSPLLPNELRVAEAGFTGVWEIGNGLFFTASGTRVLSAAVRSTTFTVPRTGWSFIGFSRSKIPKLLANR